MVSFSNAQSTDQHIESAESVSSNNANIETPLSSIFSQEEMLINEQQMLSSKMNQIKSQTHSFVTLRNERNRIIKLIDEKLYKAVDIKLQLIKEISNQTQRNEDNKHLKMKCSQRLTELLIKKEQMMIQIEKEKEERNEEKEKETNDDNS